MIRHDAIFSPLGFRDAVIYYDADYFELPLRRCRRRRRLMLASLRHFAIMPHAR